MIFSWILSFLLSVPPLLGWGRFDIEENGMSCAPSWKNPQDFSYNIFLFIVGFFCPLAIISVTGICILVSIKRVMELEIDFYYFIYSFSAISQHPRCGDKKECSKGEENDRNGKNSSNRNEHIIQNNHFSWLSWSQFLFSVGGLMQSKV